MGIQAQTCSTCGIQVDPREEVLFDVWCPRCHVWLSDQQWRERLGANLTAAGLSAALLEEALAGCARETDLPFRDAVRLVVGMLRRRAGIEKAGAP